MSSSVGPSTLPEVTFSLALESASFAIFKGIETLPWKSIFLIIPFDIVPVTSAIIKLLVSLITYLFTVSEFTMSPLNDVYEDTSLFPTGYFFSYEAYEVFK